ncbi:MAG: chorismate synthase [Phycisphaerales bacterium]
MPPAPRLDYSTAGESHGPAMLALIQGLPAGLRLDLDLINGELRRRQGGYGRGGRQRIESDVAKFLTGVRRDTTIGSPLTVEIVNKDSRLDDAQRTPAVHRPRPGHADLAGSVKWLTTDCRETLERASARETAARVAAGAIAKCLLRELGIEVFGFVRSVGGAATGMHVTEENRRDLLERRDASEVYCFDHDASERMIAEIRQAKIDKDTVGGLVEAHVFGCPPGLGSCADWRDKLDARLAFAVMGIQAFKAVEIGLGKDVASRPGSAVHDPIRYDAAQRDRTTLGFTRDTNNAGGLEGGMTNGQPVVVRGAMKPISTLLRGLPSVDLNTKQAEQSDYERSDVSAVPAASVVMENVVAFEIARATLEKFGGDSMTELKANHASFMEFARSLPLDPPTATIA